MSDNQAAQQNQPGPEFWERANAIINLANSQCDKAHRSEVSASSLYAVARFNAFIVAVDSGGAQNLQANKDQALEYFVDQFRKMMTVNIDDFIDNYDKFLGQRKA